ncbi:protein-serine/threonine phosphatase, partial [Escherichia coli]|nr:protein-serine/threonine phosphatase [Escherichia coli]EHN2282282.1 protein-serine/threonine phosphatase [Shigella sonnei]EHZ5769500.1 protein-serine/threonine phosphatase [Escherichia coli]EJZ1806682.1 protein-serine/threonine phosphatase [Escherichia coli]ELB8674990.1 protein-serine/threonine phosphatase [Escherichia coli]
MPSTRYQKINAHHYRHIWVVGDIHGEYQLLQSRLHQLSFFPETDLLISVGDNIDRGPESLDVLRLLNQPWFISVKGNHEAMALDAFATGDGNMWLASGGDWFFELNDMEQKEAIGLLLKFHQLPHIIEITNDIIKYVIAHADYPGNEYLFGGQIAESELLWPVDRVQKSLNGELQQINGADYFIFGHMM